MEYFQPEGAAAPPPAPEALRRGIETGTIFQAMCVKCDEFHNLHLDLGPVRGIIPREETALGIAEGTTREIAILSRVGRMVSFRVLAFDPRGLVIGSRRSAQESVCNACMTALQPGDILPAVVQNAAGFGVFCDIGCGLSALMRIDRCCVSRLDTTARRYVPKQRLYAAVLEIDRSARRVALTGRELLGTWAENAAAFRPGQVVPGVVRSVMPYGSFVELTPNLSGLTDPDETLSPGDAVGVCIRSIAPETHKIKLTALGRLERPLLPPIRYFHTSGHLDRWEYYPGSSAVTVF